MSILTGKSRSILTKISQGNWVIRCGHIGHPCISAGDNTVFTFASDSSPKKADIQFVGACPSLVLALTEQIELLESSLMHVVMESEGKNAELRSLGFKAHGEALDVLKKIGCA